MNNEKWTRKFAKAGTQTGGAPAEKGMASAKPGPGAGKTVVAPLAKGIHGPGI